MISPDNSESGPGKKAGLHGSEESLRPDSVELLRKRARDLAIPVDENRDNEEGIQILEFLLSGERYAIGMNYVREVAYLKGITQLPGTPPFILGIISLRGSVISIVDLRVIFDLSAKGMTDYNRVIVLADEKMSFGVLADAIIMTHSIRMSAINRLPPTVSGIGASYLIGVLPGPLMVIDAQAMLRDSRMVVGDE